MKKTKTIKDLSDDDLISLLIYEVIMSIISSESNVISELRDELKLRLRNAQQIAEKPREAKNE